MSIETTDEKMSLKDELDGLGLDFDELAKLNRAQLQPWIELAVQLRPLRRLASSEINLDTEISQASSFPRLLRQVEKGELGGTADLLDEVIVKLAVKARTQVSASFLQSVAQSTIKSSLEIPGWINPNVKGSRTEASFRAWMDAHIKELLESPETVVLKGKLRASGAVSELKQMSDFLSFLHYSGKGTYCIRAYFLPWFNSKGRVEGIAGLPRPLTEAEIETFRKLYKAPPKRLFGVKQNEASSDIYSDLETALKAALAL